MSLPIYDAANIRLWDQFTIDHEPVASVELMERAATACAKRILASHFFDSVSVFCGTGNNGGDGLVIARIFQSCGINVKVYIVEASSNRSVDFEVNLRRLDSSIPCHILQENNPQFECTSDLIIDAIFGSGLNKPISGWVGGVIDRINELLIPIVSIDIPSGLFCLDNSENDLKHIIKASTTFSFQSPKMPFFYERYRAYTGDFHLVPIGLHQAFQTTPFARFTQKSDLKFNRRDLHSHKGKNGYLLSIGGYENYAGAAILSAKAAFRAGCGYVAIQCSESNRATVQSAIPEALYWPETMADYPQKMTALAIGCGLGKSDIAHKILADALQCHCPLVVDADAINLLASNRSLVDKLPENTILTPHLKELTRLIGEFELPEKLLDEQRRFSMRHKIWIIQKGAFSKITSPEGDIYINSSGNSGMATAGMGDVLTGVIGSLLAQGRSAQEAAVYGTFIHGYAADLVKREHGEVGMMAGDVANYIQRAINGF